MADLEEELQRLAAQAASDARPLPPAEVLRRGDRQRRITRNCVATVAAVLAVTGGVLAVNSAIRTSAPQSPATRPVPAPSATPTPFHSPGPKPARPPRPAPSRIIGPAPPALVPWTPSPSPSRHGGPKPSRSARPTRSRSPVPTSSPSLTSSA